MPSWTNYSRYFRTGEAYQKQEQSLVNFLKTLQFDSVLEIGASFGRITKLIQENFHPKRFLAIDPAPDVQRYDEVEFWQVPIEGLNTTERFDLVIAVETLMHIKHYQHVLDMMKKFSKKYVIHLDYHEKIPAWPLGEGNYLHEFEGIKLPISTNQAIFYYEMQKARMVLNDL